MIKWNTNDINVEDIIIYSKVLDIPILFNNYRLYGSIDLMNEITIGYMTDIFPQFNNKIHKLITFFDKNGLNVKLLINNDYHWKNKNIMRIGLNEHIREDTKLSSAILKTIIGVGEGKILLTPKQLNKEIDLGF